MGKGFLLFSLIQFAGLTLVDGNQVAKRKSQSSVFAGLKSLLRKNVIAFSAFLIPFGVRSIPEILSWPYLIGFDTVGYVSRIQEGYVFSLSPVGFLKGANLFYLLSSLTYGLIQNAVIVMKVLGPLMLAVLCFLMYLYARKGLGWSGWQSLLVAVLVSTYFVSLRNSSDLYRQTLGLIFLMAALVWLKSFSSPRKYYVASVFMVLTVLSHEIAAVILFFVVALEAGSFLVKKLEKEFLFLALTAVLPLVLFLFQRYSPQTGGLTLPGVSIASGPSLDLALYMGGLLVYCYAFILPLVFLGFLSLKNWVLRGWALLCLVVVFLDMLNPNLFYIWYRWVIVLVYPLLFFATQGLASIWRFSSRYKGKVERLIPKVFALAYLLSLLTLSGYYLTTSPASPYSYFSQNNPYLTSIPSSMLQNTISIQDNPSFVNCVEWLNQNTPKNSVVVENHGLYDLISIYIRDRVVVHVIPPDSSTWSNNQNETALAHQVGLAAEKVLAQGHSSVYTVWWISGKGWYGIPSLPSDFREIYRNGNMAVYSYKSQV